MPRRVEEVRLRIERVFWGVVPLGEALLFPFVRLKLEDCRLLENIAESEDDEGSSRSGSASSEEDVEIGVREKFLERRGVGRRICGPSDSSMLDNAAHTRLL